MDESGKANTVFASTESRSNFDSLVEYLKTSTVTAIVGAGLSVPMKPTWRVLYEEMQQKSGITPLRSFDGDLAPLDLADFRDAMGAESYLVVLRRRFGGVVSAYPDLYARLDETLGFHKIVTTNYDEFLAAMAVSHNRIPDLAVYPDLRNTAARYVYLHGRAETAGLPADLVVCEDDYARAYGNPGQSRQMLKELLNSTGVFIGSSLEDLDLRVVLRERARLAVAAGLPVKGTLFAILPEPKPTKEQPDPLAALEIEARRLQRFDVRPIYYIRDSSHTQLRSLLIELRHCAGLRAIEPLFLERAADLDNLASVASPTAEQVGEVEALIRTVPEHSRHFFNREDLSAAWFDSLKDSVIVPSAVEPWELREGRLEIAVWPAAHYIERLASERPKAIVELIHQLHETKNWHVRTVLGRIATTLPTHELLESLPVVTQWMNDPLSSNSNIAVRLSSRVLPLVTGGEFDAAFELLEVLLAPTLSQGTETDLLTLDDYWLSELTGALSQLVTAVPDRSYAFLKSRLISAIAASGRDEGASSQWRRSIEDNPEEFKLTSQPLHFLLDQSRNALGALLQQDINAGSEEVGILLQSKSMLLRRLALSAVTTHPEVIPLLSDPILSSEYFEDEYFHEVALLIHNHFAALDETSTAIIHEYIRDFEPPSPDESVEEYEFRTLVHRWRWLHLIPSEFRTDEECVWWEEGVTAFGQHPEPFFRSWRIPSDSFFSSTGVPESRTNPLQVAWDRGGAIALAAAFRETQGWDSGIADLIRRDPQKLLELAPIIGPEDGERVESYLRAYDDQIKRNPEQIFPLDPLIELIGRISERAQEVPQTATAAARFIRAAILSKSSTLSPELLERAMGAMIRVITDLSESLTVELDLGESIDQPNNPGGAAADAFMFGLWKWSELSADQPRLPDVAAQKIAAALDEGWGGLQMRHAIGQFWPVIEKLDRGWLERNAVRLWPEGDEPVFMNARRAFVSGFLLRDRTGASSIQAMRHMFTDLVQDLAVDEPTYLRDRDLRKAFVEHLATAWLWEVDGFGFEGVLGNFITSAPESERANFVWHLGRMHRLKDDGTGLDVELTKGRQDVYWQHRVADLGTTLPIAEQSEELSAFCTWPFYLGETLSELEDRLKVSIDHLVHVGYPHSLLQLIATRAEAEPLPALNLLLHLVDRLQIEQSIGLWSHSQALESSIDALCRAGLADHREKAQQLADKLGRGGLSAYARKLDDCSRPLPEARKADEVKAEIEEGP